MKNNCSINFELRQTKTAFDSLSVYRNLLNDKIIQKLYKLICYIDKGGIENSSFINLYNDFFVELTLNQVDSLNCHIINLLLFDENPFSMRAEKGEINCKSEYLKQAAESDLSKLQMISKISSVSIKSYALECMDNNENEIKIINSLPDWKYQEIDYKCKYNSSDYINWMKDKLYNAKKWEECIYDLTEFYKKNGCGIFGKFAAFVWEHKALQGILKGIKDPDAITLSEMVGYDSERSKIIENTLQFINGYPANNVLIYGDRGTGKSSTVKALLNEYHPLGLRIVEVPKMYLADFPEIIRMFNERPQKFIIFIDDLAFEDSEESYTALKAILEGGLESKPKNVIIYATSNRRHLIKEKLADRAGLQSGIRSEEVHAADIMQEKLSLADRFGITAVFSSPDQARYLKIVDSIALKRGLKINKEKLHREALKWELWYNGRSPRTARQFIDYMEGYEGMESLDKAYIKPR